MTDQISSPQPALPPLPPTRMRFEVAINSVGERMDYTEADMRAYATEAVAAALASIQAPEGGLRAAAQKALDYFDSPADSCFSDRDLAALRAALAARPHPAGHTAALAARSATAIACLPDAPYKVALQKLHDDMLASLAAQPQAAPVALTDKQITAAWRAWPELSITSAAKAVRFVRAIGIPAPQTKEPTNDR